MDRAGLLEMIAGKTRSNTAAAILSNTKDLEEAYKSAMEAEGSAYEENEKYLDSIQGRIDLFNNSVQTMWSNTLDSEFVKSIVDLGTELIKVVDTLGLIPSLLMAIGAYKGIQTLFKSFSNAGITISSVAKSLWSYITGVKVTTNETVKLTQAELMNKLTKQGLTNANAEAIIIETGLGISTDKLTRETFEATMATLGYKDAQIQATSAKIFGKSATDGLTLSDKLLRTELVKTLALKQLEAQREKEVAMAKAALEFANVRYMIGVGTLEQVQKAQMAVEAASIPVDLSKISTTELLSLAFTQLTTTVWAATKAIATFLFTNPVGWLILAIGIIAGGIAAWNKWGDTTENLTKRLENLKSELQDVQSEIDSLNSELETTQDRMAELLAMESLSFTEKEELDNLRKQNDELQRRLDLLDLEQKQKQQKTTNNFVDLMEQSVNKDRYDSLGKREWYDKLFAFVSDEPTMSADAYLQQQFESYEHAVNVENGTEKRLLGEQSSSQYAKRINELLKKWTTAADGLEYGENQEANEWLDYVYNLEDKWAIIQGGTNAKSNAINRIFNKKEFEDVSKEIEELAEKYKATGDETILEQINRQAKRAKADLDAVGLSVKDAVDYFTLESSGFDNTFDGILKQYAQGNKVLQRMMSSTNFKQDWGEFFTEDDEGNFEARVDKFGEILTGMDEEAQETFISVVESAVNGADDLNNIDWTHAISSFNVSGIIAATKVMEEQFSELNSSVFKDLENDISGFIDKFSELSSALESVASSMDLLNTAQKQMSNSGQISVKTALELIESTDRWSEVLTISEGKITLNKNAEDVLVQSKLNTIKANIDEALTSAQLQLQQLGVADTTLISAEATDVTSEAYSIYTNAMNQYKASIAAFGAAIGALMEGDFFGIGDAATNAYDAAITVQKHETRISASDLKKRIADLQSQKDLLDIVGTTDKFGKYYDFDETPGDKSSGVGSISDKIDEFQNAMDYWENRIGAEQSRFDQIQNEIDLLEKQGKKAGTQYYLEQIEVEKERLSLLEQQRTEATSYLSKFAEGSEEWWKVANTLNDIEGEIDDVTASIQDLNDAQAEVAWYIFDEVHKRYGDLIDDLKTIRELIAPKRIGLMTRVCGQVKEYLFLVHNFNNTK